MFCFVREVQNILCFSLNTAEQSLTDTQPHVVVKLIEGRNRRLKSLDFLLSNKMKDIEQRSIETCAVNTTHLEAFSKKALDNSLLADEMTQISFDRLNQILKLS